MLALASLLSVSPLGFSPVPANFIEPFTYSTTTNFNDFGDTWPPGLFSGPRFHNIATWGTLNPPNDISDQGFKKASGATVTKVASVLPFAIPYPMALQVGKTRAGFIKEVVASATGSGKAVGCYLAQKLSPDPADTKFIPRNIGQRTSQELADAKVADDVYLMVPAQFCGGNCWTADATGPTDCQNTCPWIGDVYADRAELGEKCETNTEPNCTAFCVAATGKPNGANLIYLDLTVRGAHADGGL